jgi:D-beta-D-heptose 7-phosphate kinase/D-beta-D-heptose 1-phosphate adenosyltransferase
VPVVSRDVPKNLDIISFMYTRLLESVKSKPKVLLVGDVLIDRYWFVSPKRVSPEAPIVNFTVDRIVDKVGGAGNVLLNLLQYKDIEVHFAGVVSTQLYDLLRTTYEHDSPESKPFLCYLIADKSIRSRVINRLVLESPYQQLARFDEDHRFETSQRTNKALSCFKNSMSIFDLGVISDYNSGAIDWETAKILKSLCTTVVVDPTGSYPDKYQGADIVVPNKKELYDLTGGTGDITRLASVFNQVVCKEGSEGCSLPLLNVKIYPCHLPNSPAIDPTGAGDTFIACLAARLACGVDLVEAATQANKMAGISVTHHGCFVPKNMAELEDEL